MSTLRISNIEAKADNSSPTVDEQLKFTNSTGDVLLHLDGRTSGITTVGINTTNQTIKFDQNNNILVTGIVTATEFHGTLAVGTSVTYGDNEKAYFGNGLDLQLYHNATRSYIQDNVSNDLRICSNAIRFRNGADGSTSLYVSSSGETQIYHNGNVKLATTNTGAVVTGILTATSFSGAVTGAVTGTASGNPTLANGANNRVVTATGANTLEGEANLQWDGETLYINRSSNSVEGLSISNSNNSQGSAAAQLNLSGGDNSYANVRLECNGTSHHIRQDGSGNLKFYNNTTERLRIASDGEVFIGDGLGTADRNTILSVSGANQDPGGVWTTMGIYSSDSQAANKGGSIGFGGQDGSTTKQQFAAISGVKENGTSGNYAGKLRFWTRPAGAVSLERMTITSGGTVGINRSSPDSNSKLDVMSDLTGTTVNSNRVALFRTNGGGRDAHITLSNSSNTPVHIGQLASDLYFTTNSTERLRIKSTGVVQIGTSGTLKAEINNAVSGHQFISQCSDNNNGFEIYQQHGETSTRNTLACYNNMGGGGAKKLSFAVVGDGDGWFQATTSTGSSANNIGFTYSYHSTSPYVRIRHSTSNSAGHTIFHMLGASGNLLGEIKQDGSGGVTYHSASDYRLKENVVDLTGAITRLKNLKPRRFNFKISKDVTQDGFLAHELQEVVPIAVSGTKDEVVTDESKGNIPTLKDKNIGDPVHQTVDTSRVIPLLTAALQEAITKIETLETKVAALESA